MKKLKLAIDGVRITDKGRAPTREYWTEFSERYEKIHGHKPGLQARKRFDDLIMDHLTTFAFVVYQDPVTRKLLCTTRDKPDTLTGWGLIGGKRDQGETPRQCALRESREEGIIFDDVTLVEKYSHDGYTGHLYVATGNYFLLNEYKEKHRGIKAIEVTLAEFLESGWKYIPQYIRRMT
jgi:8-oxo-dGTP pyrophosphatase MutT (NUDIX family)